MIAYVTSGSVKVGDTVVLELHARTGEILTVVQATTVTRVELSKYHHGENIDEVEF